MSDPQPAPAVPPTWEPLPPYERRVLGVLIEKQKTSKSADAYPMTLNSIDHRVQPEVEPRPGATTWTRTWSRRRSAGSSGGGWS